MEGGTATRPAGMSEGERGVGWGARGKCAPPPDFSAIGWKKIGVCCDCKVAASQREDLLADMRTKKYPEWRVHTGNVRAEIGISTSYNPWTGGGVPRPGVPDCERVQELVNVAMADRLRKTGLPLEEAAKVFFARVCQSVHMKPWGVQGTSLEHFSFVTVFINFSLLSTTALLPSHSELHIT